MKVLVYGAGVIGCYLTHVLCAAGNDVTLLARGEWKEHLECGGMAIRHVLQRKTTIDHPKIAGGMREEAYDAVLAVMQHQQMWGILDDLAGANTPLVVLVGNNMSAPEMERYIQAHTKVPKTVLFGFQGTAGRRENGKVICARLGGGSMSIGALHSEASKESQARITALFQGTKYALEWMPNMDAWYKCHVACILPICYLCYTTGCNLRHSNRRQRKQLLDAIIEAYALLTELGYPLLPPGEEDYCKPGFKQKLMAALMFVMAKTVIGDLAASDHCRHAVTEMEGLDNAWAELRAEKPAFPMPNWDALRGATPNWAILHQQYENKEGAHHCGTKPKSV